jgi:two-component sensor histidine kinase
MIESENRVHSIALAHDLLYESEDLSSVDLGEYMQAIVRQVRYTAGSDTASVEAIVMAGNVHLDIGVVVSCGLIVTELLTNALTHAFPDGRSGHVWIGVRARGNEIELEVEDDGAGIAAGTVDGFGLHLVRTLAQRLGGTMSVERGSGTAIRVVFPMHTASAETHELSSPS